MRKGAAVDIPAEVKALPLATLCWTKDGTVIEKPDEEKMTLETEEVRTWHLCLHLTYIIMGTVFFCHICKQLCTRLCIYYPQHLMGPIDSSGDFTGCPYDWKKVAEKFNF